jgi:transposase
LSRFIDVGADFEAHRAAVESVSVLFDLSGGDAAGYATTGSPGEKLPTGWVVTAAKFEVEWPAEEDRAGLVRSHFGARRKAFNWGLAQVKADLDAKTRDPCHQSVDWDLKSLRWAWNRAKDTVAPWWAANSKECYSSGLADLAQGLANWKASKNGTRKGRRVGFPRFTSARRDPGRVRFSTGTMRVHDDRRTITVPVIGGLRCKENTRRVQRHLAGGRAQILHMTLSQRWGRLFVAICYALRRYGHLVIETLDLAAMKRSMGRRGFRRSVSDAAMGLVKPQLVYKTARYGAVLTMADRWFASSQIHHGHTTPDGTPCRLIGKGRIDKKLVCPHTGEAVDRDHNAALNLRDWPDYASCGPVGTTAPSVPGPTKQVGTGHGTDVRSSDADGASRSPHPGVARSGEARTQTPQGEAPDHDH